MFGLFKKKEDPDRKRSREEFDQLMKMVMQRDPLDRMAVGHAINMVNTLFYQRFGSLQGFMRKGKSEQNTYLQQLREMQESVPQEDVATYVGMNLFIKWVASIVMEDKELMVLFTEGISLISEEGDMSGMMT